MGNGGRTAREGTAKCLEAVIEEKGSRKQTGRTLTDGGRCDEGALGDDAGLASGHAGDRGALLRLAKSTPIDGGHAYRGSERLSEHREGVWLGQLRVCRA